MKYESALLPQNGNPVRKDNTLYTQAVLAVDKEH
jgi:hypothetical protein